jgi:hypothetical protein
MNYYSIIKNNKNIIELLASTEKYYQHKELSNIITQKIFFAILDKYKKKNDGYISKFEFIGEIVNVFRELENKEMKNYLAIYYKNNFVEHYEVNTYITQNDLWDNFFVIRSKNYHLNHKSPIRGILPKYFAVICEKLNMQDEKKGNPLEYAKSY